MFDQLASFLLRARWPLLAGLLLITLAAGWFGVQIRFDFSPRSIFLTDDPEVEFLEDHRKTFGDEDGIVVLLVEAEDIFAAPALQAIADLSEHSADVEHATGVLSLATMQQINGVPGLVQVAPLFEEPPTDREEIEALRQKVLNDPLMVGRFVNEESTAAAVLVQIEDGFVDELERRPLLAALERIAVEHAGPTTVQVLGVPVVNREYAVLLQNDMLRTVFGALILVGILLWVLFRDPLTVALPLTAVGLAVAWTVGYMVLAGDGFNIINSIVPALLLVIAVGDAVHFLTTYYQALHDGESKEQAIRTIVRRVGMACLLTSVTAAIGFASLAVARIDIIKGMGRVAAVGLLLAYVIILVLLPTALSLVNAPGAAADHDPREGWVGRLLVWLGEVTTKKKGAVVAVSAAVVGFCLFGAQYVETDNFLLEELFPSNPVYQGVHRSEEVLAGVMPVEVVVHTDAPGGVLEPAVLKGMQTVQAALMAEPFLGHSVSLADLIAEIQRINTGTAGIPDSRAAAAQSLLYFEMSDDPSFLDSLVDVTRSKARVTASAKDWGTSNFLGWYEGSLPCDPRSLCEKPFTQIVDEAFGTTDGVGDGIQVRVTGGSMVAARALSKLVEDMMMSLATAFLVITLLMMVLLKSLRIGLLSMLPNVLPLVIILGVMGWVGIPIRTSTALIFSVALGVAVNDTIHFLTRYREELFECGDREEAVKRTLLSTGRAIIFTSLLLICGFGVMMTTRFVGIFQMGLLGAVALFSALLGDLLILPVCLGVFRPWSKALAARQAKS